MTDNTAQNGKARSPLSHSAAARFLLVLLLGAMTQSIVIGIHESVHAVTCRMAGRTVVEYSAQHVDCQPGDATDTPTRLIAGSAAIVNVVLGFIPLLMLRSRMDLSSNWKWFLWLFMLANWSNGFGYLIFSGISGAGDYAAVIAGWEPAGVWRIGMVLIGAVLWFGVVWLSLRVLAQIFGGDHPIEIRQRFLGLSIPAYIGAVIVSVLAGLLNPYGITGLPAVAGIMAAAGTLSPLLWTPYWFVSKHFIKRPVAPLNVRPTFNWVMSAAAVCLFYVLILGPGFRVGGG